MVAIQVPPTSNGRARPTLQSMVRRNRGSKLKRERKRRVAGFLFILPAIVLVFTFMLYPLLYSGYMSLMKYNFVTDEKPEFIALDNYTKAFSDPVFVTGLTNTLVFSFLYFAFVMVSALTIALMLFQRIRFNGFFRSAIFIPIVVPISLACLVFLWILQPNYGLLNHVLGDVLNLKFLAQPWLSNGTTAMAAIIVVALWSSIGFVTILFLAGLQSISSDVLEAAEIDGASGLKKIFYIILPNLHETYILAGTWAVIHALKVFVEPMVMTDGGPGTSTLVLYQHVYLTAFSFYDMGYASAMGYILGAIVLVLVTINYWIGRGERE